MTFLFVASQLWQASVRQRQISPALTHHISQASYPRRVACRNCPRLVLRLTGYIGYPAFKSIPVFVQRTCTPQVHAHVGRTKSSRVPVGLHTHWRNQSRQPAHPGRSVTHSTDRIEMTTFLTFLFMAICVSASVAASETDASAVVGRIHPRLFEMVTSWDSDTEQPVVTEINLDAVVKNRNQFDFSKVRTNGAWIECAGDDGRGFSRFKTIKSNKNHLVAPRSSPAKSPHSGSALTFVRRTRVFSLARRRLFLRAELVLGWFVVRHKAVSRRLRREEAVDGWLESPSTDDAHLRC